MKMKAYQYYGPGDIRYEDVELPTIKPGEILVKVKSALTCGTDLKTYRRGHPVLIKKIPSGFGHEFSGTVVKTAPDVVKFSEGDKVVAANSAPCLDCHLCRLGKPNLCDNLEFLNGAFAEYIAIPANIVERNTLKIADHISFEEAAFCEPLANVYHGVERSDIEPGKTVGVVGLGPIGLMFVRLARLKGARVIAMGRNPLKLKLAAEFGGANEIVDLTKYKNPEQVVRDLDRKSVV